MTEPQTRRTLLSAFHMPWYYMLPMLAVMLLFAVFPQIDLAVSGMFYDAARGGFYLGHAWWMDVLGEITSYASGIFILACLGWWMAVQRVRDTRWRIGDRMMVYLLLAFLIGPVLVVSLGFKEHWGRNRPVETVDFGGQAQFVPYYLPYGICEDDCSFPSGHSSRGFYFIALAIAAYGFGWAHRRLILAGAIGWGTLAAGLRILEGKHFLSDVTLAAFIVTYIAWVLFRLIFRKG